MAKVLRGALLAAGWLVLAVPAQAACVDPPAPGVDWRRCDFSERNLAGANLSGALLGEARFLRANLDGADLSGADLRRARFITASMKGIRLDKVQALAADLTKADLAGASLAGADLRQARLYDANLRDADLTGARIEQADLLGAQLAGTRWIDGITLCVAGSVGTCQ